MNEQEEIHTEPDAPPIESKEEAKRAKLREQLKVLTNSAASLQHKIFPKLNFVVPGLIPEGLTLLAGKPKVGKSFLCLDVAIAVATGGYCLGRQCEQGDVMMLFLEDTERRMQWRLTPMLGVFKDNWPTRLQYATEFPRLAEGGLDMLYLWAKEVERPRLIGIDLWERFRPPLNGKTKSQYSQDYQDLAKVQKMFAAEFPGLGIMVTNHRRKLSAEDIFDTISGTLGLNGGADTLMVLAREEGAKSLEIRGRDITDYAIIVEQDEKTLRWRNVGARHEGASTPERKKIVEAMRGKEAMTLKQIAKAVGGSYDAVKNLVTKMHGDEVLWRVSYGKYVLPKKEVERQMGMDDWDRDMEDVHRALGV